MPDHTNSVGVLSSMPTPGESRTNCLDDAQLIRAAQQGNAAAFEQLVQQYDRAVLRLAVHLTGSQEDGQDIYREAFLRAYINLPRFRFECTFYTWIYRIATNLCLDHLRRRRSRSRELSTTNSPAGEERELMDRMPDQSASSSPERDLTSRVLGEHIVRALSNLSPRERMVFELRHYHGLQLRTVAGILMMTEGTVKNTLFRATHKLRLELSGLWRAKGTGVSSQRSAPMR
jgi:RNA polymerase sigma-70 factor (ECF subfamily)